MFAALDRCWICGGATLTRYHECYMDFEAYTSQDPELAAYSGQRIWLMRCADCGFGQPERLPTLPGFFDRMYDQRWADDWVEREFEAPAKDFIFRAILRELGMRVTSVPRRLLDVGAHAGRFMHLAQQQGWMVEGVELNPRTAACAARRTSAPVHRVNAHTLVAEGRQYSAVTLIDVLEHIPEPMRLLATLSQLVESGGWVAVKVPCGPGQWTKERVRAALTAHKVDLAGNLVHVNHFSPRSLQLALEHAGFTRVTVRTGAPELLPLRPGGVRPLLANGVRLAVYAAGRAPGGVRTPFALNLQVYATKLAAS